MTDQAQSGETENQTQPDKPKAQEGEPQAPAKKAPAKKMTVKALRNFAPPTGAKIDPAKIDVLGRVVKGTVVDLPQSIATDLIKSRIVSADAAFD